VQFVGGGAGRSVSQINYHTDPYPTRHAESRPIDNKASPEALVDLLNQLPPSEPPAQEGDLLFISFFRQTRQTRLYDRANLPQAVRDIYKITGVPLEELKR
jgi:hypothetical protein